MDVSEVDGAADKSLVSEALMLIHGILDDLIRHVHDGDDGLQAEYAEDMDRVSALAHLLL